MTASLKDQCDALPQTPGVYLMKDARLQIIYVGKAKNLKARVRQYVQAHDTRPQISFLMAKVLQIDFIVTATEKDALLLENSLIKKHKPKYNVFLKDDKSYLGLKLTLTDAFPRLLETRRIKNDKAEYFGPFISAERVRDVKEFIYRFFKLRTCSDHEFASRTRPCLEHQIGRCSAPCVGLVTQADYAEQIRQVKLFLHGQNQSLQKKVEAQMHAAAEAENFEEAARLRDLLGSMRSLLEKQQVTQLSFDFVDLIAIERHGDNWVVAVLMVREATLIDSKTFSLPSLETIEVALQNFITQYYGPESFIPKEILTPFLPQDTELLQQLLQERAGRLVKIRKPLRGEKKDLLKLAFKNLRSHLDKTERAAQKVKDVLQNLKDKLHLPQIPERIECYDISNISGQFAVGSLVTFLHGEKAPEHYKKFKIRNTDTPNDYAMLFEVLKRRFSKSKEDWPHPDLILLDGGKGQIKQAQTVLQELQLAHLPIAGIAKGQGQGKRAKGIYENKKNDDVFLPGRKNPVALKPTSPELMLLQNLRDEAHRFAITYHRQLRGQALTHSWLDDVAGLGPKTKTKLLKHFGSPQKVAEASRDQLQKVAGLSESLIAKILEKTY